MIGGLIVFGILGFILGPLILAYLLLILDAYRKNKFPGLFAVGNHHRSISS
jgi:predicted PurR-regulated permease PerM